MKTRPANNPDISRPYWVSFTSDLPMRLQKAASALPSVSCECWLVFPFEAVGNEPFMESAIRWTGERLEISRILVDTEAHVTTVSPSDCISVTWNSNLLYGELRFQKADGTIVLLKYNMVAEEKLRKLTMPFMVWFFASSGNDFVLPESAFNEPGRHLFTHTLRGAFPENEVFHEAVQRDVTETKFHRWFRSSKITIPARALAISSSRIAIVSNSLGSEVSTYAKSITLIPSDRVDTVSVDRRDDNSVTLKLIYGVGGQVLDIEFGNAINAGLIEQIKWIGRICSQRVNVCEEIPPVFEVSISASELYDGTAQQTLLALTGVNLAENQAVEALRQIHNFKWLEAERVGFDTWAVIQPNNPMRAAAVHWVRKHFDKFSEANRTFSGNQNVA